MSLVLSLFSRLPYTECCLERRFSWSHLLKTESRIKTLVSLCAVERFTAVVQSPSVSTSTLVILLTADLQYNVCRVSIVTLLITTPVMQCLRHMLTTHCPPPHTHPFFSFTSEQATNRGGGGHVHCLCCSDT
jgi:hypothetical protein